MVKNKKTIYIFGNPLLAYDSLPVELKPELEKEFPDIDFIIQDPNENLKPENGELVLIDTIEGIDKVIAIDDIGKIETRKIYSLHDFDLGFNLKLLAKIGMLKKVLIFGVPMNGGKKKVLGELIGFIKDWER